MKTLGLHSLSPAVGSRITSKRVGRGINCGGIVIRNVLMELLGSHCGRGNSGQNSRSGAGPSRGFEGGQTPLWKKFPKLTHTVLLNNSLKQPTTLSLDKIQHLIDIGRIKTSLITPNVLRSAGISELSNGIYVTGSVSSTPFNYKAHSFFHSKGIKILASYFDESAIYYLEHYDGFPVAVYLDANGWRGLSNPKVSKNLFINGAQEPPKTWKERLYYSSFKNRGYLSNTLHKCMPLDVGEYITKNFFLIPEVTFDDENSLILKSRELLHNKCKNF